MRTTYILDGKKVTKKSLVAELGKEMVDRYTANAQNTFLYVDRNIENSYMTRAGLLTIYFEV